MKKEESIVIWSKLALVGIGIWIGLGIAMAILYIVNHAAPVPIKVW